MYITHFSISKCAFSIRNLAGSSFTLKVTECNTEEARQAWVRARRTQSRVARKSVRLRFRWCIWQAKPKSQGKSPCFLCCISCLAPLERAKLSLVTLSEFTLPVLLLFCHLAVTTFVQSWLLSKVSDAVSGLTWICSSLQLLNYVGCSLSVSISCPPSVARAFQSIALGLFHIIPRDNVIF